jgi:cytochrome b
MLARMTQGRGGTSPSNSPTEKPVVAKVWDLPTRLFHWLLVALVVVNVVTGKVGGIRFMEIHMMSGYTILTLVLFRIGWGFLGGRHARFADFLKGVGAVLGYLKGLIAGAPAKYLGHNPLGGWSVALMLSLLLLQAGTGLFSNDDILVEGPLMRKVSKDTSDFLTYVHYLSSNALIAVIGLHVAAAVFYLAKGDNLIRPMITGTKRWLGGDPGDSGAHGSAWLAVLVLALAAAVVWAIVNVKW